MKNCESMNDVEITDVLSLEGISENSNVKLNGDTSRLMLVKRQTNSYKPLEVRLQRPQNYQ